jgi:oxygen-independent coproporphyrinogen-3 oxidase
LDALRSKFGLEPDAEVSMEMDPGTFDDAKLDGYLRSGVTRVSLGVQSFDADVLKLAGRAHTVSEARAACAAVAQAMRDAQKREDEEHEFSDKKKSFSWSLDLIGGLPGLTSEVWRASLAEAVFFAPDHVSVYDLQIEEGTPFHKWYEPGEGVMPDDETGAAMFRDASAVLRDKGFEHYEVSSYAKPSKRCRHNQVYWNSGRQGWYAFGMAATSHVDAFGERVARPRKMRDWESWVDAMPPFRGKDASENVYGDVATKTKTFTETEIAELRASALMERLMLGLRTRDGIDLDLIASEFGPHVPGEILEVLAEQPAGLAVVATRDGKDERDAASAPAVSYEPSALLCDDDDDALRGSGTVVRLTDPEGLMVSTEVISTLVARLPSLEKL